MSRETSDSYICLFRKLLDWQWYSDIPTKTLFIHCLLRANYKDKAWQNITIKRGSFISSYAKLAVETGLSPQQIKTALKKLQTTGELNWIATNKYSIFTVLNYEEYQSVPNESNQTSESNKQSEIKKSKKSGNSATSNTNSKSNEIEAFFEDIWKLYPRHKNDRKSKISKTRKQELFKHGYETVKAAIESYLCAQNPNFRHAGQTFFNEIIDNWLPDKAEQQAESMRPNDDEEEWQ